MTNYLKSSTSKPEKIKHLISRQVDRRELFKAALQQMPYFETWTTEDGKPSATYSMGEDGHLRLTDFGATRHHCKTVTRRVRRSMARDLSKRQYRNARTV